MMRRILCFMTILLIVQISTSYILLTANMEDVESLAKQLAASPVVEQVGKIWRRAASQFQKEINKDTRRGGEESEDSQETSGGDDVQRTRKIVKELIAITKRNGVFEPIKQAVEFFTHGQNSQSY